MVYSCGEKSSEKNTGLLFYQCLITLIYLALSASVSAIAAASSNETIVSVVLQYMPANTSMQGTYIPQYTQVPGNNISVEVFAFTKSLMQNCCCF